MTGGGIFDQDARLVGIIVAQFRQVENSSYAAPARWIADLSNRSTDQIAIAAAVQARSPQEASIAPVPADAMPASGPRIGDRWKYKLIDGKRNAGTVVVEIIDARGRMVTERITKEDQKGFVAERKVIAEFDPIKFQDIVTLPGGYQLTEIAPYVPLGQALRAGQQWQDLHVTLLLAGYGYGKQKFETKARVIGREKIRVPAGEFDTMRVQATGVQNLGSSVVKINCNYWYGLNAMRAVKMSLDIIYSNAAFKLNPESYELVSFEAGR